MLLKVILLYVLINVQLYLFLCLWQTYLDEIVTANGWIHESRVGVIEILSDLVSILIPIKGQRDLAIDFAITYAMSKQKRDECNGELKITLFGTNYIFKC